MNHASEWHTSALLAAAIDSVTLSVRLKGDDQNRVTFNNFEAALNTNGNQQIARLQFSARDPQILQDLRDKKNGQHGPASRDRRMPNAQFGQALLGEGSLLGNSEGLNDLDIDLMPDHTQIATFHANRSHNPAHVFGLIDSNRGPFRDNIGQENAEEEEYAIKRRRISGGSVVERPVNLFAAASPFLLLRTLCMTVILITTQVSFKSAV